MRRWVIPLADPRLPAGLVVACFGRAIFEGEQFAYRDAGHYYYPLHQRVQAEWDAGRWPLWEPEENSGMPLLGNPTAAVLYPGKLVFALFRYPLAARLYVIGHTLLAFAAMLALLRHWGTSWVGSTWGPGVRLRRAGAVPVLQRHLPCRGGLVAAGLRAVDRWLRQGRRIALAELAVVLAMETLGGDPESAYLTGLCAAGYAAALAWRRGRQGRVADGAVRRPIARDPRLLWVVATLAAAHCGAGLRPPVPPISHKARFPGRPGSARRSRRPGFWPRWCWWRGGGGEKGGEATGPGSVAVRARRGGGGRGRVSAAQLFPVLEFISQSGRAAEEAPHNIYPFSLHPVRVIEFVWPNVFGTPYHGNRLWLAALPLQDANVQLGPDALPRRPHTGARLGGLRLRSGPAPAPWRIWMAVVAVVSLLGSFGEHGSPIWFARRSPAPPR